MSDSCLPNKAGYTVLISLFTLLVFLALFVLRSIDDNRLTSWQWTFAGVDLIWVLTVLVAGIVFAFLFSKYSLPERIPALSLFLFSFVVSFFFWKESEVIVDASRYFTQAKHLSVYGIKYFIKEWGRDIKVWTDLPLVPLLYGMIFKVFGESRQYIQFFTTVLFSMTVVLTYLIGKNLWDKELGYYAGLLMLGIPYIFTQVPLMLVDVPTMFFLTLLIFTFIKAIKDGGIIMITAASIALFLAFFSKYSTWIMLTVLAVIFVTYFVQGLQQRAKGEELHTVFFYRCLLVVIIGSVLIGITGLFYHDVISQQIRLLLDYQRPGLRRWGESFISTFFYQIHPFITFAALFSVYPAFRKKDFKYAIVLWLVLLMVLLQIKRIRYLIIVFPMLALMASYGLQVIKDKDLRSFIVSCAVVSSVVVSIFVYLPFLQRMSSVNLKNAGAYLDSIDAEDIEVITVPSEKDVINPAVAVSILDLFTKKDVFYQYDSESLPPFEKIEKSPLRFTWAYKNPEYYSIDNKGSQERAVVVIKSKEHHRPLPNHIEQKLKGYKKTKVFKTSTGNFRYKTEVTIFLPSKK